MEADDSLRTSYSVVFALNFATSHDRSRIACTRIVQQDPSLVRKVAHAVVLSLPKFLDPCRSESTIVVVTRFVVTKRKAKLICTPLLCSKPFHVKAKL